MYIVIICSFKLFKTKNNFYYCPRIPPFSLQPLLIFIIEVLQYSYSSLNVSILLCKLV